MPKDNENIPFLGPVEPSEPLGFPADQMIRCEECLRANPPTRVSCLYCVAPLPLTEASVRLRKPVLRQPEKHQLGYNNILLPVAGEVANVNDAAALLKLSPENMRQLISQGVPAPVARTANREEAELVRLRLADLGLKCVTVSDEELGLSPTENAVKRVRAMRFDEPQFVIYHSGTEESEVAWSDVILIVTARIIETRLEIKERMTRKQENEIVDTNEFFRDEVVIDFYSVKDRSTWRVGASGFDFSCLGSEKALVASENIVRLQRLLVAKAVNAQFDESYRQIRNLLELVWSPQSETESSGWRRERPGKLSVGVATTKSNETQFTRYSRLRHYFLVNPENPAIL
ncbi:MAG TPA: hypothetical protein VLB46_13055 [Pyrinomonadaceae bacterium]|nr:hypothetical protein [Pyrinomonadaceae bacterium]